MNPIVFNQAPFLRSQRTFPVNDIKELCLQLDKAYIDTALAVNERTIGIFSIRRPSITGESWFIGQHKQQTLRQVYTFTTTTVVLPIPHNIDGFAEIQFSAMYGTFTDGTKWYPLPWVDVTAATNQITFNVDDENINVLIGAGAPAIVKGLIVLEWIVNP